MPSSQCHFWHRRVVGVDPGDDLCEIALWGAVEAGAKNGIDDEIGLWATFAEAVRANWTVTFGLPKKGFASAGEFTGEVQLVPIGVPRSQLPAGIPASLFL